jgi:hypothetical protein
MLDLLADPEKSKRIAQNGINTFRDRYLTPAAQNCYWRRMLRDWRKVSFEPKVWDRSENGRMKRRGVPFETFV